MSCPGILGSCSKGADWSTKLVCMRTSEETEGAEPEGSVTTSRSSVSMVIGSLSNGITEWLALSAPPGPMEYAELSVKGFALSE